MDAARRGMVDYLRVQTIGPLGGAEEVLPEGDNPHRKYMLGVLYPQSSSPDSIPVGDATLTEDDDDDASPAGAEEAAPADDAVNFASRWMPASAGLSFSISGDGTFECEVVGAAYERDGVGKKRGGTWRRVALATEERPEKIVLSPGAGAVTVVEVLKGKAQVQARWRKTASGYLVTAVLLNPEQGEPGPPEAGKCLFQVGLRCRGVKDSRILPYPRLNLSAANLEEEELRVMYRNVREYATGHGCSVDWESDSRGVTVRIEFLPWHEVPPVSADTRGVPPRVFNLMRLSRIESDKATVLADLELLAGAYEEWIKTAATAASDVPTTLKRAKESLVTKQQSALKRIRAGIKRLGRDADALKAFGLANRVMAEQMRQGGPDYAGKTVQKGVRTYKPPTEKELIDRQWRPFQLAFLLLNVDAFAEPSHEDRAVVDLLWFPTGGGKTEAYLALAAFEILLRRLRDPKKGGGTAVITRYTLRLLTAQQFLRAATMICALELTRRAMAKALGDEPFRVGLWIGSQRKSYVDAQSRLAEMLADSTPRNQFSLESCPWCGTALYPARGGKAEDFGFVASATSFKLHCVNASCPFTMELPVTVVDEDIYERPPTLLIGTLDNFAKLAWEARAGNLFGAKGNHPPSLIIQDELHLVGGPLGTIAALYETAFDRLIEVRGAKPKILASSATIRRAGEQARGLFGRDVAIFPPSGLDSGDSYFALEKKDAPGRLYLGVMAPGHDGVTAHVRVEALLVHAPIATGLIGDDLDFYWTLVIYHSSLRELGKTATLGRDDVPGRLKIIARDQSKIRKLDDENMIELTSQTPPSDIPKFLDRLAASQTSAQEVSIVACTNMFSVGVDVNRLSTMMVVTQPKSVAEYIQATSRVGRGSRPGLVLALFNAGRARDRSHYEAFKSSHQAFYREVEPSSVTPFSAPARNRALHAALVILVRHAEGLADNDAAGRFPGNAAMIKRVRGWLLERVRAVDPGEEADAAIHLDRLISEWREKAEDAKQRATTLVYYGDKQFVSLLKHFGATKRTGWDTLDSMRNVDGECVIKVLDR